ncbi:jg4077 [Pararge aegeria aegeria]|uniref:Jg4077 protein n=1 Tax=Pararge aegeria aegeria TaxID=348720 RepID=A0A8S4RVP6_9NEOP|nr:jg4077 [Pararge aegeria aegeria]
MMMVIESSNQFVIDERNQLREAVCGSVCELLARGAHVDAVDEAGITPLVAAIGGPAESLVRAALSPRLSCLAAAALAFHGGTYRPSQVPRDLHPFLAMHGVSPSTSPS